MPPARLSPLDHPPARHWWILAAVAGIILSATYSRAVDPIDHLLVAGIPSALLWGLLVSPKIRPLPERDWISARDAVITTLLQPRRIAWATGIGVVLPGAAAALNGLDYGPGSPELLVHLSVMAGIYVVIADAPASPTASPARFVLGLVASIALLISLPSLGPEEFGGTDGEGSSARVAFLVLLPALLVVLPGRRTWRTAPLAIALGLGPAYLPAPARRGVIVGLLVIGLLLAWAAGAFGSPEVGPTFVSRLTATPILLVVGCFFTWNRYPRPWRDQPAGVVPNSAAPNAIGPTATTPAAAVPTPGDLATRRSSDPTAVHRGPPR